MKKQILLLLIGGIIMTGLSANPSKSSNGSEKKGAVAVVYFSATGTTARMAKTAAQAMEADIFEIQPLHKYTSADLNWHDKKSLTSIECNDPKSRPEIKAVISDGSATSGSAYTGSTSTGPASSGSGNDIAASSSSFSAGSASSDSASTSIKGDFDISSYDTVVLCYPIWWAYAPKILYTFVESQNWSGKKLVTLCTSGGSGLGRSGSDLAKFAKGADFKGGKDFTRASGTDIKNYIEGLIQ